MPSFCMTRTDLAARISGARNSGAGTSQAHRSRRALRHLHALGDQLSWFCAGRSNSPPDSGGGSGGGQVTFDSLQYRFRALKLQPIFKSRHANVELLQELLAAEVIIRARRVEVCPAVELDRQPTLRTIEVHDVISDAVLPPELLATEL